MMVYMSATGSTFKMKEEKLLQAFSGLPLRRGSYLQPFWAVVATAIPKATNGFRAIGSFSSYYRMLVRTTSPLYRQWEQEHPNKMFSFAAGRSAVTTVWAQAAQQEISSAIGKPSCATIL